MDNFKLVAVAIGGFMVGYFVGEADGHNQVAKPTISNIEQMVIDKDKCLQGGMDYRIELSSAWDYLHGHVVCIKPKEG